MTDIDFSAWTEATGNLKWGVQRVFLDTLKTVEEGKATLIYGADYSGNNPCLVNAVATMLSATGGEGGTGIPLQKFGPVVREFDRINHTLRSLGVNTDNSVSPLAAELLIRNFGPLNEPTVKDKVKDAMSDVAFENAIYVEPSDEDMARDFLTAISSECPTVEPDVEVPELNDKDLERFFSGNYGNV